MVQETSAPPTGPYHSVRTSSKQSDRNGALASRILSKHLHTHVTLSSQKHTTDPFISEEELIHFLQDLQDCFPSETQDVSIPPFQPFRLQLFRELLVLSQDPDHHIAELLQDGIPSGAFTPLAPTNLWEKNTAPLGDTPDLHICQDNWMSANQNRQVTSDLIQAELEAGFIEEIPDLPTAEKRWPKGIAMGKLGVVYAENRDPGHAGSMARRIHRRQGSSQKDAYPRRRTRFTPLSLPKLTLCISNSSFWSKDQCMALGSGISRSPSITPQIPFLPPCGLGLC